MRTGCHRRLPCGRVLMADTEPWETRCHARRLANYRTGLRNMVRGVVTIAPATAAAKNRSRREVGRHHRSMLSAFFFFFCRRAAATTAGLTPQNGLPH